MLKKPLVELPALHAECNGCAYAKQYTTHIQLSYIFGWQIIIDEKLCRETDCRSYPLYKLMKGIK